MKMQQMKTIIQKYSTCLLCTALFLYYFTSCKKADKADRQITIAAANSVQAYPGNNRIKLSWKVSDLKITRGVVYWTNDDSIEVPFTEGQDTMSVLIPDLEDANYSFRIYLYDAEGHNSSQAKVVSRVYGQRYIQSLTSWSVNAATYNEGTGEVEIIWGNPAKTVIGAEISYTDITGLVRQVLVAPETDITRLANYRPGFFFNYRTLYKPVPAAIDTFYTQDTISVISGKLKDIAEGKHLFIGSLITYGNPGLNSHGVIFDGSPAGIYTQIAKSEFNLGQATWWPAGGWKGENSYDFADVNAVINWCKANDQYVMQHNILGPDNYMPDWFVNGSFSASKMDNMLKDLITQLMNSNDNKSKVNVWDVMNEAFNEDGTYRDMKWNDMGWEDDVSGLPSGEKVNLKHPAFIGKALQYCRALTNAKLEIRDYGIEINHSHAKYYNKHKAFYQLIKHLQAKGDPIDCIGIQAHRTVGIEQTGGVETFKSTISKFKETGLDVLITELDIASEQSWTDGLAEQQKNDYYTTVKAAIEAGVKVISFWGIRDENDPYWLTTQHPLLFDKSYTAKPAYNGVRTALFDAKVNQE